MEPKKKLSFKKWWRQVRPTKTVMVWSWVATVVVTMIIGFAWGGWVTGSTAQRMAKDAADDAVIARLGEICVVQFNQDPARDQKLEALRQASTTQQRRIYVQDQGWASIGDEELGRAVSDECVRLLMLINP
jgi:hypothetical protein